MGEGKGGGGMMQAVSEAVCGCGCKTLINSSRQYYFFPPRLDMNAKKLRAQAHEHTSTRAHIGMHLPASLTPSLTRSPPLSLTVFVLSFLRLHTNTRRCWSEAFDRVVVVYVYLRTHINRIYQLEYVY